MVTKAPKDVTHKSNQSVIQNSVIESDRDNAKIQDAEATEPSPVAKGASKTPTPMMGDNETGSVRVVLRVRPLNKSAVAK